MHHVSKWQNISKNVTIYEKIILYNFRIRISGVARGHKIPIEISKQTVFNGKIVLRKHFFPFVMNVTFYD